MKINTITCHKVYNYGASLQQFALIYFLQTMGHETKTINYQPKYLSENYSYFGVSNKRYKKSVFLKLFYILAKFPSRFKDRKRRHAFNRFEKDYIPTTKVRYLDNQQLKSQLPYADIYICGSDQIWNTIFENGKDPAFYLDFVPNSKRKISYAASFATESIPESLKDFLKEKIGKLDYVSVREQSGCEIIARLGINSAHLVLDPVFLLSAENWVRLFVSQSPVDAKYILVYDFENKPIIQQYAIHLRENFGLRIISVNNRCRYADFSFWQIGPDAFLNLLFHSSYVLGNSFHAAAFSIIFEKQFLVFERSESINSRMTDLIESFDLKHRMVNVFDKNKLQEIIDYTSIRSLINQRINHSKSFLINSIGNNYETVDSKQI